MVAWWWLIVALIVGDLLGITDMALLVGSTERNTKKR